VVDFTDVAKSSLHHFSADFALPILLGVVRTFLLQGLASVAVASVGVIPVASLAQVAIVLVLSKVSCDLTSASPASPSGVLRSVHLKDLLENEEISLTHE
jgi:hypothetical protein